jgi:hypothetical protein
LNYIFTVNDSDGCNRDVHATLPKALWDFFCRTVKGEDCLIRMPNGWDYSSSEAGMQGILGNILANQEAYFEGFPKGHAEIWIKRLEEEIARTNPDKYKNKEKMIEARKDHINPSHYQSYAGGVGEMETLQWLETMQYTKNFRDPDAFIIAVELQARKYIDRLGGKDGEVQEILKGIWYLRFIAAFIANGKRPIRVRDIPQLLGEVK